MSLKVNVNHVLRPCKQITDRHLLARRELLHDARLDVGPLLRLLHRDEALALHASQLRRGLTCLTPLLGQKTDGSLTRIRSETGGHQNHQHRLAVGARAGQNMELLSRITTDHAGGQVSQEVLADIGIR